ncbi:magnesium transporter [Marinagarivorans algicola]|uniref:magnesium transporter n=1 Tax=Marinagarivorans algicola TaxID=1513270 RepID=UPI0006B935F0|nr:magnesium transporter [Marinagarivorans algicola]
MNTEQLTPYIERLLSLPSEQALAAPVRERLMQEAQEELSAEQLALMLEAFPAEPRMLLWQLIKHDEWPAVFICMREDSRRVILDHLGDADCKELLMLFDAESLLEVSDDLSAELLVFAQSKLDDKQQKLFEKAQLYSDEQLGHWIRFDCLRVSARARVGRVRRLLDRPLPSYSSVVYLTNAQGVLVGEVKLQDLYRAEADVVVGELPQQELILLNASGDVFTAAERVIHSEQMALPVIDSNGTLLGCFDLALAYQTRQEEQDAKSAKSAGLSDEEDLFAPVLRSSKNRAVWLGINLLTAFLASWFIGLFEATLQEVVALAVLMPVVASMGGISGSQTLTVIVRGLAMGQVTDSNRNALLQKELRVGALNGVLWAIVIGIITYVWFGSWLLGVTIAIAININIVTAVISGVLVPYILKKLNFDPALAGAVVLTTVTDIVGFVAFLGLGSLLL